MNCSAHRMFTKSSPAERATVAQGTAGSAERITHNDDIRAVTLCHENRKDEDEVARGHNSGDRAVVAELALGGEHDEVGGDQDAVRFGFEAGAQLSLDLFDSRAGG